jgi:hypothetical protein
MEQDSGIISISMKQAIEDICKYHKVAKWPDHGQKILDNHRLYCLSLMAECIEVLDAVPWKPWRPDSPRDLPPAVGVSEELVDMFFFMCGLMEIWDITPELFIQQLDNKLRVNYERLTNGVITPGPTHGA